jgi:predicted nucleic acid-binding protein
VSYPKKNVTLVGAPRTNPARKRRQRFAWIANPPEWLTVLPAPPEPLDPALLKLDSGERAAIALARSVKADGILMDDRAGVVAARTQGFAVVGTLGILDAR